MQDHRHHRRAPVDLVACLAERMGEGGSVVNISSILGAEWPQRLDLHKALAETPSFEAGLAWLARHPMPQETCYQYFKDALIVWTVMQSQKLFLQRGVRMNCVAPGPVFTPILGDFVQMLGEERVQKDAHRMKRPTFAVHRLRPSHSLGCRWRWCSSLPSTRCATRASPLRSACMPKCVGDALCS